MQVEAALLGAVGPVWVEVDLDAIAWNVARLRQLVEPARLCAVVKADAYGHGAAEVARAALDAGADRLGVSSLPEALELRLAEIDAPILVFTPLFPADAALAARAGVTPTIVGLDAALALDAVAERPVAVHLKVDTGLGRYGVMPDELPALLREVAALPRLRVEGVFTHFARPGEPARAQLHRFLAAVETAEAQAGVHIPLRHAAASSAVLTLPEATLDMARVGNLIYGIRPMGEGRPIELRPAWRMRAAVAQVRRLPRGTPVGYGAECTTRRPTLAATLPFGFAEGAGVIPATRLERVGPILRALARAILSRLGLGRRLGAPVGAVELNGTVAPPLGRGSMQQTTVDVTGIEGVAAGSIATVHCRPTAASARLARVFIRDGVPWRARTLAGNLDLADLAPAAAARD